MTPEHYGRIGELYHQVLARPVEQRAAWLAGACGDDTALRQEVMSLVAAHDAAASFIESPAIGTAAAVLAAEQRSMAPGARIGPYEVRALLGRGGMGEVYRAHDPRLGRDVALKLLPVHFALDPQRLARFEREARLLASLNHPNIAALYGIEESNGRWVLVLELVEGSTLDSRLASGLMSIADVVPIARQIVEALEAAHEQGIIHRDLKPANIVIRPDGVVKVLDFGLAKALDPNASSDTTVRLTKLTEAHTVIGTAPYMSPEQARGMAGDQGVDIWAFGCVLYEMLTGCRAFDGDSAAEVFSAVLQRDPDWTRIPPDVPSALQRLLRLCLEKDPRRRRQSSGDVRIDLEQVQAGSAVSAPAVHARGARLATLAALGVAIVTTVALAALAVIHFREGARLRTTWLDRTGNQVNELQAVMNGPELSPDGRHLAGDRTIDGNRDIWLFDLVRDGLTRVTTHPAVDGFPLWSPDGSRLAFHSARNGTIDLWIKPSSGAAAEELLLEQPESEWPIHWSKDGRFLLYQRADLVRGRWDLWALPMTGGDRTPFPVADTPFAERLGEVSPNGRWVVYDTNESGRSEIVVQSFPEPRGRLPVSTGGGAAPRWRADETEIHFLAPDGRMIAVPVHRKASTLEFGTPAALFSTHIFAQTFKFQYAVSDKGQFVINSLLETTAPPIVVILNARAD